MRQTCMNLVYELAKQDPRVVFVGSDLGVGTLKQFKVEMGLLSPEATAAPAAKTIGAKEGQTLSE